MKQSKTVARREDFSHPSSRIDHQAFSQRRRSLGTLIERFLDRVSMTTPKPSCLLKEDIFTRDFKAPKIPDSEDKLEEIKVNDAKVKNSLFSTRTWILQIAELVRTLYQQKVLRSQQKCLC